MIYKKLGKLIGGANSKDWDTKHSVYSPIKKKGKLISAKERNKAGKKYIFCGEKND